MTTPRIREKSTFEIEIPEFNSYEEEAEFWDNLDTSDYMPEAGWEEVYTDTKRAMRVAILPEIVAPLRARAHAKGVSVETLINVLLANSLASVREPVMAEAEHKSVAT